MWPLLAIPLTAFFIRLKVKTEAQKAIEEGAGEFHRIVKRGMTHALFFSLAKWLLYLTMIFAASNIAKKYGLKPDLPVALAIILLIYSFYAIVALRFLKWCADVYRHEPIFNPFKLLYVYIYHEIYLKVGEELKSKSVWRRAALLVFGPSRENMARTIANRGMTSLDLWLDVALRVFLWVIGWFAYCMMYRNVFWFAVGIEFNAWWQPLVWPFGVLYRVAMRTL